MKTPRIGITTYGRDENNWFRIPAEYVDSVRRAGGLPMLIAPGERLLDEWLGLVDAMVLTGGGDLDAGLYGGEGHPETYMVDAERDATELAVARRVLDDGIPTLGICRGTQLLNVALGGTLIEHLPDEVGDAIAHRAPPREPTRHRVAVDADSMLARIMQATDVDTASWHHQAIRDVAEGFDIVARAADGTIEALARPGHPWLIAVQWHPELTAHEDATQQRLFDELVAVARGRARASGGP